MWNETQKVDVDFVPFSPDASELANPKTPPPVNFDYQICGFPANLEAGSPPEARATLFNHKLTQPAINGLHGGRCI